VAWTDSNSWVKILPVGTKAANAWGIHDMSGSVWEWIWDWFDTYPTGPVTDPQGTPTGTYRVNRGGSFDFGGRSVAGHFDYAVDGTRAAYRVRNNPILAMDYLGFRIVRNAE
jgi:formylglycine-generating enzyme required for sulfatase activity